MKIKAYKSARTGDIFEKRKDYKKHVLAIRKGRMQARAARDEKIREMKWFYEERAKIQFVEDIIPWIMDNQIALIKLCNKYGDRCWFDRKMKPDTDEYTKMEFSKYWDTPGILTYSDTISNTHECPDNGVTNWGGKNPDAPTSYPGFSGRIEGTLKRARKDMADYPTSDFLKFIGIKTGSGGGGNEHWGYDCRVFIDDWPGIKARIEAERYEYNKDLIAYKLKGQTSCPRFMPRLKSELNGSNA